jgi:DNA helicase-2/ATP-dependent DNA helicase PcrA
MINKNKAYNTNSVLNQQQQKAIFSKSKYTLVMASAGTGKTRVLVERFLYILSTFEKEPSTNEKSKNIFNIMALTFTNKAAKEMLTRINKEGSLFVGTFHSICLRILRTYGDYNPNVIDENDSQKILTELGYGTDSLYHINQLQDKGFFPENIDSWNPIKEIYINYLNKLKKQNLIDFGGIILETIKLLKNPEIGKRIRERFSHILVDEYQDTSLAQEILLLLLTKDGSELFCVGDPRQSVYEWRGASRENILKFHERYEGADVIKLNENYRSTREILNFANKIMETSKNNNNIDKDPIIGQYNGDKVKIYTVKNPEQEGRFIASKIHELHMEGYKYKDMAILTRSNMALRIIEQNLNIASIPYKIFGGIKFFDREEIKTIIAYLRLIINEKDTLAFDRVIQTPRRGVGLKTLEELKNYPNPFEGANKIKISKKALLNIQELETQIYIWRKKLLENNGSLTTFILDVIEESGLKDHYIENKRLQNLKQFAELGERFKDIGELVNSFFSIEEDNSDRDEISLMTFHMSKGLEFQVVFLPCWSEGFFPHPKSVSEGKVDEEMRLAYVATTRAKKLLYISFYNTFAPCRFLRNTYSTSDVFKVQENY